MTLTQAHSRAKKLSKKTGEICFVVYVPEDRTYDTASDYDMDTWFAGIADVEAAYENGKYA